MQSSSDLQTGETCCEWRIIPRLTTGGLSMRAKFYLILAVAMLLCLMTQAGMAQGSRIKVVASFTHPVNVGQGQVLQPGQYTFDMLSGQTDRDTFRVRGQDGKDITLSSVSFDSRKMGA